MRTYTTISKYLKAPYTLRTRFIVRNNECKSYKFIDIRFEGPTAFSSDYISIVFYV